MSNASLASLNTSTVNPGFNGNFSSSSYVNPLNCTVNNNRSVYTVSQKIVNASYNFDLIATAANIEITALLPIATNIQISNINEVYFSAVLITRANGVTYSPVTTPVSGNLKFIFPNPATIGINYSALIEIIYKID